MTHQTRRDGLGIVFGLAAVILLVVLGSGCVTEMRVMTDSQYKTERMGRITWNGSDQDNTLKGAKALEKWRQENNSPLAKPKPQQAKRTTVGR